MFSFIIMKMCIQETIFFPALLSRLYRYYITVLSYIYVKLGNDCIIVKCNVF